MGCFKVNGRPFEVNGWFELIVSSDWVVLVDGFNWWFQWAVLS